MKSLTEIQEEKAQEALQKCKKYKMVYIAMDTRTGKTCTSLKIADKLGDSVLFVTKKDAIKSVKEDAREFGIKSIVTVTNHEQMHNNTTYADILIIDEAHRIGKFPKKFYLWDYFKKAASKAKHVMFLSATPAPETWSAIYHQLRLVVWSEYKSFYRWADDYVIKKQKKISGRYINDYSHARKEKILKEIDKYFVRCSQKEAGITAKVDERIITATMSNYTKSLFHKVLKDKCLLGLRGRIEADTAAKLQNILLQIASGSVITSQKDYLKHDISKAIRIKKEGFTKIAIFYKYKTELKIIQEVFDNVYTNAEDFQKADAGVFAGQFVSKREGIRLDTAEALFMFNIDFAYLSYKQTKDRIMSLDRKAPAQLCWVFSDIGFEKSIYKVLQKKKNYNSYFFRRDYL